jgi:hypothetical protein
LGFNIPFSQNGVLFINKFYLFMNKNKGVKQWILK